LGQGLENAKTFLRDNPDLAREIELSLRQNSGLIADRFLQTNKTDRILIRNAAGWNCPMSLRAKITFPRRHRHRRHRAPVR
ncbi:hypothetical protein AB9E26_36765, partial [Rhizobium leguminosarum]